MPESAHISDERWDDIYRRIKSDPRTDFADAEEVRTMNDTLKQVVMKQNRALKEDATEEDKRMERYKMILGFFSKAGVLVLAALLGYYLK